MLLTALILSAIALASCVDVPVPDACSAFADKPVGTLALLDVDCTGEAPSVVVKLDPSQSMEASQAELYVEAVCTWNQTDSQTVTINWTEISPVKWISKTVSEVPSGANCTFAGCYLSGGMFYLFESRHCVYDRDECILGEDDCHENATCESTIDGYECHCQPMFTGNGRNCTENPLPTPTSSLLPTPTSSFLPTSTPGAPEPADSARFSNALLFLLVLVPVAIASLAAVVFTLLCYSRLRRRYLEVSLLGKVDPTCMLVNPKTDVRRPSVGSISSEFDKLTFTYPNWWGERRNRYQTSQSLLEIQKLDYQLKLTNGVAEEDIKPAIVHSSSLPNIRDSFKMEASPKADTTPNNDTYETSRVSSMFYGNPMTAEYMMQPPSSLLADNMVVDWCLEDVASLTSDSNLLPSATENGTSLGPTHQSDSHTQSLAPDPAPAPVAVVVDRAAPTDSTELGTLETRLADSLTHEQPGDKFDEEEEEDDGEYFVALDLSDVDDSLSVNVDSANTNNVGKGLQYYDASVFSQVSSCDGCVDLEERKRIKYIEVDLTLSGLQHQANNQLSSHAV